MVELAGELPSGPLSNPDLAPTAIADRTWNTWHIASLWIAMSVCIPTYMLASSMVSAGLSWRMSLLAIVLGNAIVLVPLLVNGHAGTRYGIPFPVYARAAFGTRGANLPSLLRSVVACGWFGIQTWIGGAAIYTIVLIVYPGAENLPALLPEFVGIGIVQFACFMLFWAMNIYLIYKGIDSIKVLETLAAPFLILCGLALLAWAYMAADGFGPMLSAEPRFENSAAFWKLFFPSLTAMVGFWSTLCLNISDFTRYSKDQRAQVVGQISGLPTTMTLFAFIGVAVTSATIIIYGEAIWDPVVLVRRFDSPTLVFFSMVAVVIATISTNAAANVVGPANNFSNMWPSKIDFKMGGYITGVIGIVMMPWKLLADPSGYIFTWLIGYSALLGPVLAVILTDYFLVRRTVLNADDLYRRGGVYSYRSGFNPRAIIALVAGVLPNIPGFLAQVGLLDAARMPFMVSLYDYAWFIGLGLSGIVYYILMRGRGQIVKEAL